MDARGRQFGSRTPELCTQWGPGAMRSRLVVTGSTTWPVLNRLFGLYKTELGVEERGNTRLSVRPVGQNEQLRARTAE